MASKHSALLAACLDYITARGGLATRLQAGRVKVGASWVHLGKRGWPDIVGVLPAGQFLAVEVKVGTDRPTRGQSWVHTELKKRGALVVVVRDLRDLEAALEV